MVTEEQYQAAVKSAEDAEKTIQAYHAERAAEFKERMRTNPIFTADELVFAATSRCKGCGAGLAYPKNCGIGHYWDCSNVLMGKTPPTKEHEQYPFAFYSIKSEQQPSANGATTRPQG